MIHDQPASLAAGQPDIVAQVHAFVRAATAAAADGLTWAEFGSLMLALLRVTVATLDAVTGMTGAQKKTLVMDAVAVLFDAVADKAVPAVAWPVWLLARPAIRSLVLALASGAIEVVLPMVRVHT